MSKVGIGELAIIQPVANIEWKHIPVLDWAKQRKREAVELIRRMVELESPSDDQSALERFASWFAELVTHEYGAMVRIEPGSHLLCSFGATEGSASPVLVLGHYDTVWPTGTLANMPFREENGRLWGPGVLDMKGGIAMALMAIRATRELQIPTTPIVMQLNADEEIGSHTSRGLTELNAKRSRAVLVLEPGTGLTGKLKTARKGVGDYRIQVMGRASHAGVDFAAGASAILELSRQLLKVAEFSDFTQGITVNPGVISGGTRGNVVAAEAYASIDVRVQKMCDALILNQKFHDLQPVDSRCSLVIKGGLNRPPMERSDAIIELFEKARALGREIDVEVEESSTGGGSDGNFTAALGRPTLDGIGAVGEGAHAANESILVNRIADRIALLAMLLATV